MIIELGHFVTALAVGLAFALAALAWFCARQEEAASRKILLPLTLALFVHLGMGFVSLVWAFSTSDFSVALVATHSHSAQPMLYKLAGVWGNHEGSLLLWTWILAAINLAFIFASRQTLAKLLAWVVMIQALLIAAFLIFLLATSNPFARFDPAPAEGLSLNPILQDPALAFHPPTLFLGYVGFSLIFSLAVGGLLNGKIDAAWARIVRPWALLAWGTLTGGIALGSFWAYYELGWGGFWFWDPVENASLMPWFSGAAMIHGLAVLEHRGALASWTALMGIVSFSLSILGTFLVRSGVLTSVHAFANDPERGLVLLGVFALATGGALILFAMRAPLLARGNPVRPFSREGMLLFNNLLLMVGLATLFVGTLYPIVLQSLGGPRIAIGPPYFNETLVPFAIPLAIVMAVAPLLPWQNGAKQVRLARLVLSALVLASMLACLAWFVSPGINLEPLENETGPGSLLARLGDGLAALWFGIGGFLLATTLMAWRHRLERQPFSLVPWRFHGGMLAHLGFAVLIMGIAGASLWAREDAIQLDPGEGWIFDGFELRFEKLTSVREVNYVATRAEIALIREDKVYKVLTPEVRFYLPRQTTTSETAIYSRLIDDLHLTIRPSVLNPLPGDMAPPPSKSLVLVARRVPLIGLVWMGAAMMTIGALAAALPHSKARGVITAAGKGLARKELI